MEGEDKSGERFSNMNRRMKGKKKNDYEKLQTHNDSVQENDLIFLIRSFKADVAKT